MHTVRWWHFGLSGAIPLPFLRILLAFIVAFILMMVAKARAGR